MLAMSKTILDMFAAFFAVLASITSWQWDEYRSFWGWNDLRPTLENDPRQHSFDVIPFLLVSMLMVQLVFKFLVSWLTSPLAGCFQPTEISWSSSVCIERYAGAFDPKWKRCAGDFE